MASSLYSNTGVGWLAVSIEAFALWLTVSKSGLGRLAGVALVAVTTFYIVHRFNRCYIRPWGRVHHRAMLAFSGFLGQEMGAAEREGRETNRLTPLSILLRFLNPLLKFEESVVSFTDLYIKKGQYLAELLESHPEALAKGAPDLEHDKVLDHLRALEMGPQMVIARTVEYRFGREEAARYVVAVVTGRAR